MYTYFPVSLDNLDSEIEFQGLEKEIIELEDAVVSTQNLNHPGRAFAYRIENEGSTLVYSTDTEPYRQIMGDQASLDSPDEGSDGFDEQVGT